MNLIETLVNELGVNDGQARGGAGLLLKLAKEKLGDGDFSQLKSALPDADEIISAAPSGGGGAFGALGGLMSRFGGGKLGDLASLAGGFSELDLDKDKIMQFVPAVLNYFQNSGNDDVKKLLEKVLKF